MIYVYLCITAISIYYMKFVRSNLKVLHRNKIRNF